MDSSYNFDELFVFDLANNHQGSVAHGTSVIRAVGEAVRRYDVRGALKFQFRELDSFVHPAHKQGSANKHIPRFLSTRLDTTQFQTLFDVIRAEGLIAMTTPFDEPSVELAVRMGFDILKVASCSAQDWPLLERIAAAGKPVIFSTGGCSMTDIDNLVSFFDHRGIDFAIMHCISMYPTPIDRCMLNQIAVLRSRYPGRTIGWSTHEEQDEIAPVQIAYAKGARIFERHVGMEAEGITLNSYSSRPEQLHKWLEAFVVAKKLCGPERERLPSPSEERQALESLRRGMFARRELAAGDVLGRDDVYFAMPWSEGQLYSGQWRDGIRLTAGVRPDAPLLESGVEFPRQPGSLVLKRAVHQVKAMLNEAQIHLDVDFSVEYSHHYGVERFAEIGCVMIDCVNREYCKKLIVQTPGQSHPLHYHRRKEETFQVLAGELFLEIEGRVRCLRPGETALVLPGVWHRFWTAKGAIVEEISTTHFNDDSFYRDPVIQNQSRDARKTKVEHWGRFELVDRLGHE